ncbi:MAG: DNA/RNA non-specific endonuclease [Flavobacteriaceae bacterium]|nr:DNA/RNA non-specific endonuclease [Flavobacteriaceae bacterium]
MLKRKQILAFFLVLITGGVIYYYNSDTGFEIKENKEEIYEEVITNKDSLQNANVKSISFLLPKPTSNQIVKHTKFVLSYNETHEQADWVAYKLDKNSINNSVKRKDNFRVDPKVTTISASLPDYKNSGYDRGHLAPAKAMSFSKETMSESFYMSNMSPQKPSFNRGIWKKLEEQVRDWIAISDSLYVVTGPVLDNSLEVIGENKVTVPRAYYKTILRFKNAKIYGIGFLLKNEKSSRALQTFSTSIDSIEKVTQLDFYYLLADDIENIVEKNKILSNFLK